MPYVKCKVIHTGMKQRLEYILNPEKTEGMFFCDSHNCFPDAEDAYLNMKYIYENYTHHKFEEPMPKQGKARVKLLHYVQSFSPDDDVTPELAHRMGKAWIRKAFGDNVQAVIATHTDKAHIHNHVIINTYGVDGHKYNDNKKTLSEIREHSDRVCLAFGIQPIMNNKHLGMSYKEWDARRKGASWKEQIRREIDTLVLSSKNFDELAAELEAKGYEIKYGAHTAVRAPGQKRFTRLRTIGDDYTIENIKSRILWKDDLGNASREDAYNKGQVLTICFAGIITQLAKRIVEKKKEENKRDESLPFLPNNDRDVFALGAQLALINRLKIHSIGELDMRSEELSEKITKLTDEFNALNVRYSELDKLLQQTDVYDDLSGRDKLSLSEKMRLQIIRQTLSRHGISDKSDIDRLTAEKRELDEKITALKTEIEDCHTLQKAFQEIKDTYNDISKGDYISKLIARNRKKAEETSQEMGTDKQSSETLSHDKRKPKL